jgi:hypothetical protein
VADLSASPEAERGPATQEAHVSTDPGVWSWTGDVGRLGFTVTFSLGRTPEDVLARYGADPSQAEHLTRDGAWIMYPPNNGGAQLRAGMLGRWAFCFEEAGFEGFKARTLSGLSADTETISFFHSAGKSSFIYLRDSEGIEAFEPGLPETLRGEQPCKFWTATQKILDGANPVPPAHAVLQAITKHIREPLERRTLEGPLLSVFLPDADRAPMGAELDDESPPEPAHQPAPVEEPVGDSRFAAPTWATGSLPLVTATTATPAPAAGPPPARGPRDESASGNYDSVYSRFSREAQAS